MTSPNTTSPNMTFPNAASTALFSDRSHHYARYRPSYPAATLDLLRQHVPAPADAADVAAGTGILSRALAAAGYRTVAVEPNRAMRAEIEAGAVPGLRVVEGTGESTGLPDGSVDLITVAQAVHWLDPVAAPAEFRRIARPGCRAAVVWNTRDFTATPFMRDYLAMLTEYAPAYGRMKGAWAGLREQARAFFPGTPVEEAADNTRRWDLETLLGNLWSLSYVPRPGDEGHDAVDAAARRLFATHQRAGRIDFVLSTIAVVGPVGEE
ncbi:class I SAM-dependent methyltransferase [Streptomyces sp. AV19]|uniref:class I SAM-dependent methyltransferase n=1 Tax=Streptomyces sp. AV19 TaxID=2793068 RepID=UPI0018FE4D84|nr:class I SAM-dependent methyltransferase [Streptomyces sp. AV19]MBH1933879.1 class I SAM-dependent methyltransferase [Streptomyces sp. AV19]MDG4535633.1 class I SAM-dependent methyltransferase [Streptomyces sp. AV19]